MLNKGYVMLEVIIALMILMIFTSLINHNFNLDNKIFTVSSVSDQLINLQFQSILNKESNCFADREVISSYNICFNSKGNINMAQTLKYPNTNYTLTIFLGVGSHEIK